MDVFNGCIYRKKKKNGCSLIQSKKWHQFLWGPVFRFSGMAEINRLRKGINRLSIQPVKEFWIKIVT